MSKFIEIMEDIFNIDEIQSIEKLNTNKIVIKLKGRCEGNPVYAFDTERIRNKTMYEIASMLIDRF